jgi:16S rRNA (guanine966-N2)-methyltransferase
MAKRLPAKQPQQKNKSSRPAAPATSLRIIGGRHRGRQLVYSGDQVTTRPMKDDVRESLFNLVGGWLEGKWVVDLFAGTGAVGLEAVSRGAAAATLVERHFPTARLIRENVAALHEEDRVTVETSDALFWSRQFLKTRNSPIAAAWTVFCCPPWPMFMHQREEIVGLIDSWYRALPPDSLLIVEADVRFDPRHLPDAESWRIRDYPPARVCVIRPPGDNNAENYLRMWEEAAGCD